MIKTLNDALEASAKTKKGIVYTLGANDDKFVSYTKLLERAKTLLTFFQSKGVAKGDEIVIQIDSLDKYLETYWACLLGGIIPVPLAYSDIADNAHKVFSVWPVLNRAWICAESDKTFSRLEAHIQSYEDSRSAQKCFNSEISKKALFLNEISKNTLPQCKLPSVNEQDIAFIQFSSGSTGTPKGVVLSHANLLANIEDILSVINKNEDDVFLSWKPKSHDFGMIAFHLAPLVGGVTQVNIPTKDYIWSPAIWFHSVNKYRATVLGSPNFGFQHFLKLYKRRRKEAWNWDLSCVKAILNGAEPISPDLCRKFCLELSQYGMDKQVMRCGYGLAEASLIVSLSGFDEEIIEHTVNRELLNIGDKIETISKDDENAITLVDCGHIFNYTEVRITNSEGKTLADNYVGKIEIRGRNVTNGYYNNSHATKALINKGGWVNTDDLGFICNQRLVFASRIKEMIIVNGVNYFPHDIERAILTVKGDKALNHYIACSIPDKVTGTEKLAIFVYYKKSLEAFTKIIDEIKDLMAKVFGIPVDYVIPSDKIPKTTSGKVQRFRLRKLLLDGAFNDALKSTNQSIDKTNGIVNSEKRSQINKCEHPENRQINSIDSAVLSKRIRSLIFDEIHTREFTNSDSFFDLGIPSLRLIGIQEKIESEFRVELDAVTVLENSNVKGLTQAVIDANQESQEETLTDDKGNYLVEDDIAIIGMSCRIPGSISNLDEFWNALANGVDPVTTVPNERWAHDSQNALPMATKEGGFLEGIDLFDPSFFGITPAEAVEMDPQQRLLLEVCFEAFENSGFNMAGLESSNTGVFIGISSSEYAQISREYGHNTGPYTATGNMFNTAAGRISYVFGLEGPSLAIDSACSSSLVCVNQAISELKQKTCDQVIVAAVNLILKPDGHICFSSLNALSPSGRCRSFDDSADGYIRSEGAGALVLKRLSDAKKNGDDIQAIIKSSVVNHNGHNGGLTVPSAAAQKRMILKALSQAGLKPEDIDYIETHGSGTKLGDPQEASALNQVFFKRETPLYIGSVKSNLGHLEAAAGMAGLIKVVLSLKKGRLTPNLHLKTPNSLIDWRKVPLKVVTDDMHWPSEKAARYAAINSLGINGSNAHLILQSYSEVDKNTSIQEKLLHAPLFTLSAKSDAGLLAGMKVVQRALHDIPDDPFEFYQWIRAFNFQRSHYHKRFSVLAKNGSELKDKLEKNVQRKTKDGLSTLSQMQTTFDENAVCFLFTGQGSCYPGMAKDLYRNFSHFKKDIDYCSTAFSAILGKDLLYAIYEDASGNSLIPTQIAQASIFSIEYALARLWISLGVKPKAIVGHSIGEYAAAVIAGIVNLDDAIKMVAIRGQIMEDSAEKGKMAGLLIDKTQANNLCSDVKDIWVAAENSPQNTTISGRINAVNKVLARAKENRIFTENLNIDHAFHSPLMSANSKKMAKKIKDIEISKPQIGFYSTVFGRRIDTEQKMTTEYWANHLSSPVLFQDAVVDASRCGAKYFVEIGAKATLTGLVAEIVNNTETVFAPSLRENKSSWVQFNESIGLLYKAGANINWLSYHELHSNPDLKPLPNTSYSKSSYWVPYIKSNETIDTSENIIDETPVNNISIPAEIGAYVHDKNEVPVIFSAETIAKVLVDLIAEVTGLDDVDLDLDTHLLSLGMDSLMLVQLGRRINTLYSVEVALSELFRSLHTPILIADYIYENIPVLVKEKLLYGASSARPNEAKNDKPRDGLQTNTVENRKFELMHLLDGQLKLMQDQLKLVSEGVLAEDISSTGKAFSVPVMKGNIASELLPKTEPLDLLEQDLNFKQKEFIGNLCKQLNFNTAESRKYAERDGKEFTDWIVRAHFRPEIKQSSHLVVADSAKGSRFIDVDGNEYIDTCLGFTANLFGHNPDFIVEAVQKQLTKGIILGPQSDTAGKVARLISELTGVERVAFTNSGTEAVMAALRVARAVTGRRKIVRFSTSYHGTFDGVLAQSGEHGTEPLAIGVIPSMVEDTLVYRYASKKSLELITQHATEIAAVLVEPVQTRNPGLQPQEYLKQLRTLTEDYGITLIFDEMVFGFRCHPGGIQKRFGVQADLVTYGKVVGGGLPIGVVAGKSVYMDAIDGGDWLSHASSFEAPQTETTFFAGTFCKHPLSMAAAHAVLTRIKEDGGEIQRTLDALTKEFIEELNIIFYEEDVPFVMKAFSSYYRFETLPSVSPEKLSLESDLFFRILLKKGIYICYVWENRSGSFSTAHSREDVREIVSAIKEAIVELRKGGFSFQRLKTKNDGYLSDNIIEMKPRVAAEFPSAEERRMFVLSQMEGGDLAYRLCGALRIRGDFDLEKAEHILAKLSERHIALRTAYILEEGKVKRVIRKNVQVPITFIEQGNNNIEDLISPTEEAFDLSQAPLWRVKFIACPNEGSQGLTVMSLELSHIIADGISSSVFIQEFFELYNENILPPVGDEYQSYLFRENDFKKNKEYEGQIKYWKNILDPAPPAMVLPNDFPRPSANNFSGDMHHFVIGQSDTSQLKQLAKKLRSTPFNVLFTIFKVLLHKITQQNKLCVGIPFDARGLGDFERTIGMFAQSLPIYSSMDSKSNFSELVKNLSERCGDAYANSRVPLDDLVENIDYERDASRNALFDVMFIYEVGNQRLLDQNNLTVSSIPLSVNASAFDLTLELTLEKDHYVCRFIYSSALFKKNTIINWQRYFQCILNQVTRNTYITLSKINILGEEEVTRIIHEFNKTDRDYQLDQSLAGLLRKAAQANKNKIAVIAKSGQITYADMEEKANRLAAKLIDLGVTNKSNIGVMLHRDLDLIIALLAVLKSGACYVPIDPAYPKTHIEYMLQHSDAKVLISYEEISDQFTFDGVLVRPDDIALNSGQSVAYEKARSTDPAYTIFTSGSTGMPKGVVIGNRSVVNFMYAMDEILDLPDKTVTLGLTSVSFDIFVLEVYLTLFLGGTLVLANEEEQIDPKKLISLVQRYGVNVAQMTPSRLQIVLKNRSAKEAFKSLDKLLIGGEAFPQQLVKQLLDVPGLKLFNVYGPTETTVWSSVKKVEDSSLMTLGKPIGNTRMYILDADQSPVPIGVKGDLYIAGAGLASGYFKDEDKTRDAFSEDPFNSSELMYRTGDVAAWTPAGELRYFGRNDNQVKLRGYRIELTGVEAAILELSFISNTAVLVREISKGNPLLVAFCTLLHKNEFPQDRLTGEVQSALKEKLPEYMIPGLVVELDSLPLTPNSKIDRKKLPHDITPFILEEEQNEESKESYLDGIFVKQLVIIWKDLLGDRVLSKNKSFFDLGGNSMGVVLMQSAIDKEFPGLISVSDVFSNPTIQALHTLLEQRSRQEEEKIVFEEIVLPSDYFQAESTDDAAKSLELDFDKRSKEGIQQFADRHAVETYDVELAMHALLLNKMLNKETLTVYSSTNKGLCPINLDFKKLKSADELVKEVFNQRHSGIYSTAKPSLDRTNKNGVLTLFVDDKNGSKNKKHAGFDMVININSKNNTQLMEFDNKRLSSKRMTKLANGYLKLVKVAVAEV